MLTGNAEIEPRAGCGVVSGGGVVFRVVRSSLEEKPGGAKRVVGRESRGVEGVQRDNHLEVRIFGREESCLEISD
nr:hypothetical protein [Tanacetum cinerariifolium]GEY98298.1 hypothetical protein [Tanacetum cinerariifolium]